MTDTRIPPDEVQAHAFRVRDVFKVLGAAFLVALLIRALGFEGFRIPTESMEQSLLVGDFVLVSKLHYGPRLPVTLGVPLTSWYLDAPTLPVLRLPGFTTIRRGDPIVFNYPADRVPLDRKMHFVKRVVALPGDTVAIREKMLYVNGHPVPLTVSMQQRWVATIRHGTIFPTDSLRDLGVRQVVLPDRAGADVLFESTTAVAEQVAGWPGVERVEPAVQVPEDDYHPRIFPAGSGFSRDRYGPVAVPQKGDTLRLTAASWSQYEALVTRYEGHEGRLTEDGRVEVDGVPVDRYVVRQDYYFVLGDNRDSSVDSRVWGYVPADHVVGKVLLVYFSLDPATHAWRSERWLKRVQ